METQDHDLLTTIVNGRSISGVFKLYEFLKYNIARCCILPLVPVTVATVLYANPAQAQLLTGYDAPPVPEDSSSFEIVPEKPLQAVRPLVFTLFQSEDHKAESAHDVSLPAPQGIKLQPPQSDGMRSGSYSPFLTYEAIHQAQADFPAEDGEQQGLQRNNEPRGEALDLSADNLFHDEGAGGVHASGDVMMAQAGRILRADTASYFPDKDRIEAEGHVVLNEDNGDIHYAERVEFQDRLNEGAVQNLRSTLADGSQFTAKSGSRRDGVTTTMKDATYSPCEPCVQNPDRPPLWRIRASEVTHDKESRRISYENARFEVMGVPIAYTPYFSHPDGSIKRKSGFVSPSAGYKSELGAFIETGYYWAIAPHMDATIGLMAMTEEAPLLKTEWRQRWEDAELLLQGGITYSERPDRQGNITVQEDQKLRGHVLADFLWDIDQKWRAGLDINWASDDQYMRQYDFSDEDVLENDLFLERFSGRNYAVARLLTFQDVRVREEQEDQPEVLPEIEASFIGEPGSVPYVGGRWQVDASALGLRRAGEDQDVNRLSSEASWRRRFIHDFGAVTQADLSLRGDAYFVRDRAVAQPGSGLSDTVNDMRLYPLAHLESSYPLVRYMQNAQVTLEPVVSLTMAPDIEDSLKIPDEDSQDVQIDPGNVFNPNRFPGMDRVEDRSRVTYGLRAGYYGLNGSFLRGFLGQSYRFNQDDNPFPEGSGLDKQRSDLVGSVATNFEDRYMLDYRFQFDSDGLTSERHEINAHAVLDRFQLSSTYLFAKALEGTSIDESREQLQSAASYYLTPDWRIRSGLTQDLGGSPGLRKAHFGFDYFGQCVSWSLTAHRNLTDDSSGESDTEIVFSVGLKNLGEFQSSGFRVDTAQ